MRDTKPVMERTRDRVPGPIPLALTVNFKDMTAISYRGRKAPVERKTDRPLSKVWV